MNECTVGSFVGCIVLYLIIKLIYIALLWSTFSFIAYLSCESGEMIVKINFTEPFRGVGYSDYDRSSPCKFYGDGSKYFELRMPLKGCGTKQVSVQTTIILIWFQTKQKLTFVNICIFIHTHILRKRLESLSTTLYFAFIDRSSWRKMRSRPSFVVIPHLWHRRHLWLLLQCKFNQLCHI